MARMPKTSSADTAARAALDLIEAMEHPHQATPSPNIDNMQLAALCTLSEIFHQTLQPTPLPAQQLPQITPPGRPLQAPTQFLTMPPPQEHIRPPPAPVAAATPVPAPAPRVPVQQTVPHPATPPRVTKENKIPPRLVSPGPMQHMPPRTPPMFIPMSKDFCPVYFDTPQPHVIPQVYTANFAAMVKPEIIGKYVTAANILANSVVDEHTRKILNDQDLIKSKDQNMAKIKCK
eukprot:13648293-Ditylum_brightwellii.AAC.1